MRRRSAMISALVLLAHLTGCGSPEARRAIDIESSNLRWLMRLHTQAVSQGAAPTDEASFKQYLNSLDSATLDRIRTGAKVSNVDELFISERDGEPFVFFFGQRPPGVHPDLLAYERTGVGGKRYVGYGLGNVEEVDEERFAELVPPASRPE